MNSKEIAEKAKQVVAECNGDYRSAIDRVVEEHGEYHQSEVAAEVIDHLKKEIPRWQANFSSVRFPVEDMPDIPATWRDGSWHDDVAPCFYPIEKTEGDHKAKFETMCVWVLEKDPEQRELSMKRFNVVFEKAEGTGTPDNICVLETDDWQEVLDYVTPRVELGKEYLETFGYNPFLEDPDGTAPEDVEMALDKHKASNRHRGLYGR